MTKEVLRDLRTRTNEPCRSKQSLLERGYYGNDVKGGLRKLFGEEAIRTGKLPNEVSLPAEIMTPSQELLGKSDICEWSTSFLFKKGVWTQGKVYRGTDMKVVGPFGASMAQSRDYSIHPRTWNELVENVVPVIKLHTHPANAQEEVVNPFLKKKYSYSEDVLKKYILAKRVEWAFPCEEDIYTFLRWQRKSAIMMIMSAGGSTLMVHNAYLGDLELKDLLNRHQLDAYRGVKAYNKGLELIDEMEEKEEYLADNLIKNPNNNYAMERRVIYLKALDMAGEEGGFASYHAADPKSPVFKKVGKIIPRG